MTLTSCWGSLWLPSTGITNMDHTWLMLCPERNLKLCACQVSLLLSSSTAVTVFLYYAYIKKKRQSNYAVSIIITSMKYLNWANLQMGFLTYSSWLKYPKLHCSFPSAILTQVHFVFETVGYLPRSSISCFWNMVSYAAQSNGQLRSDI